MNTCLSQWCDEELPSGRKYCGPAMSVCQLQDRIWHTETFPEYFWNEVDESEPDECWYWRGKRRDYYPAHKYKGVFQAAHVTAWKLSRNMDPQDPVPDGQEITHICDEPSCCNPSHLTRRTHHDNLLDMARKGRSNPVRGEDQLHSKLTESIVRRARKENKAGASSVALAKKHGVSQPTMNRAINGKSWAHVK